MKDLPGRTALITGASAGIGKAIAQRLAAEKMNVVLAARSENALETLAKELETTGVKALAVPTDLTDSEARKSLVNRAIHEFGTIDVLVNNAGVDCFHPTHTLPEEEILLTVNLNLTAAMVMTRLVLPHMLESGSGHIVNLSSTAGKFGPICGAVYGATKSGMIAFTESLRGEYHGTGVSATVICPGFTNDGGIYEEMKQSIGRGTPLLVGATSTRAVTKGVVKAIKHNRTELMINLPALRPLFVLKAFTPGLAQYIVRKTSARFTRRAAEANEKRGQSQ